MNIENGYIVSYNNIRSKVYSWDYYFTSLEKKNKKIKSKKKKKSNQETKQNNKTLKKQ